MYRRLNCYTLYFPHGEIEGDAADKETEGNPDECLCIRYCKFQEIPALMTRYCEEARRLLNDATIDVFMKVGCSFHR